MKIQRTEHVVAMRNLPEEASGLRVVHLTDFHRCDLTPDRLLKEAVSRTNALCPDLIVLTGDYIRAEMEDIAPVAEILAPLKAALGVYGILGNHDYYADGPAVRSALEAAGITMLVNQNMRLPEGLWVVGVDDDLESAPNLDNAFAGVPTDEAVLTLIHNPRLAKKFADRSCVALAGHTHGGQVVLPFITAWKLRHIGAENFRSGWYDVGNVRLYVNRGLGNAGVSFRFGTPPEIALFTLEPSHS